MSDTTTKTVEELTHLESCLVDVRVGDKVLYHGEEVTLDCFYLAPNGINDPKLIACVYATRPNGNRVQATADKFAASPSVEYQTRYPSDFDSARHFTAPAPASDATQNATTIGNALRSLWLHGVQTARSYGDNIAHLRDVQEDKAFANALASTGVMELLKGYAQAKLATNAASPSVEEVENHHFEPLSPPSDGHDMKVGPCSCGAWHSAPAEEVAKRIAEQLECGISQSDERLIAQVFSPILAAKDAEIAAARRERDEAIKQYNDLYDAVMSHIPQKHRQNSLGAVDCVARLSAGESEQAARAHVAFCERNEAEAIVDWIRNNCRVVYQSGPEYPIEHVPHVKDAWDHLLSQRARVPLVPVIGSTEQDAERWDGMG